ncbi:mCG146948 [Mus musculus]|nr:mCG146948 [Mus musculus]
MQNHNYRKTELFAALLSQLTFPPSSQLALWRQRRLSVIEMPLHNEV